MTVISVLAGSAWICINRYSMHVDAIKDNLCVRYLSIVNLCTCGADLDLLRSAYLLFIL